MTIDEKLTIMTIDEKLTMAEKYYNAHGNLKMPSNYRTKDGINESYLDKDAFALGYFVKRLFFCYINNEFTQEQIQRLNKMDVFFEANDDLWYRYYEKLKKYYQVYGNIYIPYSFKTCDGVHYSNDKSAIKLGLWLKYQVFNNKNGRLSDDKIRKLKDLDFMFQNHMDNWNKCYILAKRYYKKHNNLLIHYSFKTLDGVNPSNDDKAFNLGAWINRIRINKKKGLLTKAQINQLEKIGMIWDLNLPTWHDRYQSAYKYHEKHGNLNVPINFKTLDGINFSNDINAFYLNAWINFQRKSYYDNRLSQEKIDLLNQIDMVWDVSLKEKKKWLSEYEIAKAYYEQYGNLSTSLDIKNDALNKWLNRQRYLFKYNKLSQERIILLNQIGMIWTQKADKKIKSSNRNIELIYLNALRDVLKNFNSDKVIEDKSLVDKINKKVLQRI